MVRWLAPLLLISSVFAQVDGPATLPQRTPTTTFVSPNAPIVVTANLAQAVAAAKCGDTLSVQGLIWTGGFTTPSGCSAANAITIAGSNGSKIILNPGQEVRLGSYVRFTGFEVTRLDATYPVYAYVGCASGSHDQIIDHNFIHGTPSSDSGRAIDLGGCINVAVLNNTLTDLHCASLVGTCTDSQGIAGGYGDVAGGGNFLIDSNYIEAAAEDILFGGSSDSYVVTDITITRNVLTKPLSWNPADPSYVVPPQDHPFIVKNLFELKNGARVLFEGNTLSNAWGGFTQSGFAILLTPKNQAGANGANLCPVCAVTDVTVRYNTISHAGEALQLSVGPSSNGGWPSDGGRWSIHDNNFFDLQYATCYKCAQELVQVTSMWGGPILLHDLSLVHNNFGVSNWITDSSKYHGWLMVSGPAVAPQIINIHIDNNVAPIGNLLVNAAGGGAANCIYGHSQPADIITACFAGTSSVTGNVLTTESGAPAYMSVWPAGNAVVSEGADLTMILQRR